ncbi:MAG: Uma2 family endonuclease [Acidobacteriia bacterium]|nr:Uma2 family endonuclease [Terriglobia bacterium]
MRRQWYNPAMRISAKFSYEDLQHFPPDHNRYEIVDGELFVTPAPIPLHQRIVMNLGAHLWNHVRAHHLGEVFVAPLDVVFTSGTVLEPDIIFVSRARLQIIGEKYLAGPPDLVVEVLSKSSSRLDRDIKPKQYARYGVPEFWLIDPEAKTVEIFRLQGEEYELAQRLEFGDTIASPLFPGLNLPVSSLWECF